MTMPDTSATTPDLALSTAPVSDPSMATVTGASVSTPTATAGAPVESSPAPDVTTASAITLTPAQFQALLDAAKAGSGVPAGAPAKPVVHLTADEVPKVGSVVRDAHGRPAVVLEVLETTRVENDGTSWTQFVCHVGSFTEARFLDAEELGAL